MTRWARSFVVSLMLALTMVLATPKTAAADWNTICQEWLRTHDAYWTALVWNSYEPDNVGGYLASWSRAYNWLYGDLEEFPDQNEWFLEQFTITFTNACGG